MENETNSKEVGASFFKNLSKPARIGIIAGLDRTLWHYDESACSSPTSA